MKIQDDPVVYIPGNGQTDQEFERAISMLNKKIAKLGLFRTLREKSAHEKPGDKRRRKLAMSIKRTRRREKGAI